MKYKTVTAIVDISIGATFKIPNYNKANDDEMIAEFFENLLIKNVEELEELDITIPYYSMN